MARQSLNPMDGVDSTSSVVHHAGNTMTHLKYLRKKNGYTLENLSKVTNISVSYLSRLESGARRLNTDLIRRLSHAFACEPSELLQETSHDKRVITPIDFSARGRSSLLNKSANSSQIAENTLPMKDIPVYCLSKEETENGDRVVLLRTAPIDWRYRPAELIGKDVFALKPGCQFRPYFSSTAVLYLSGSRNLTPEAVVIIAPASGDIMLKKVWSITPTNIQLCEFNEIDDLKNKKVSSDRLITMERDNIQELYRVVGFSDFEAA